MKRGLHHSIEAACLKLPVVYMCAELDATRFLQ